MFNTFSSHSSGGPQNPSFVGIITRPLYYFITAHYVDLFQFFPSRTVSLHDLLPIPRSNVHPDRVDDPIPPSWPACNSWWSPNTPSHREEASSMDKRCVVTST